MFDKIKPTHRDFDHNMYILHVGTNNVSSNKHPKKLSEEIVNLAESLKLRHNTVAASNIEPRNDLHKKKAEVLGTTLEKLCKDDNTEVIIHGNINIKRQFNSSDLPIFARNFRDFLKILAAIASAVSITLLFILLLST